MTQETEREKFNQWLGIKHCGAAHDLALAAWQARAALEAKQAEVKMPEPAAVVHAKLGTTCMIPGAEIRKGDNLYTKQQLRTLLAQHGIKIAD